MLQNKNNMELDFSPSMDSGFGTADSGYVIDNGGNEQNLLWDESGYVASNNVYPPATEQFGTEYNGHEFNVNRSLLVDGGDRFGVSTVTFDNREELMWMGNRGGHVTSYYGSNLQKYTSFQVHPSQEIRQILPLDEGILILTQNLLRWQMRRGLPVYSHTSPNLMNMQCMLQISPTRLLLGGHQETIVDFDLHSCQEAGVLSVDDNGCAILRHHNRFICCGNTVGRIDLRDPNTLSIAHTLETHSGSLNDFDIQGNYLVTCGFSSMRQSLTADQYVMVHDLRQMRALSPVTTLVYPYFLKFLPRYSSRLAVVSSTGQMQLLDTIYANVQPSMTCFYQVITNGAYVLSFDVSSTSQCLGFGDAGGSIHLMSSNISDPKFNTFSRPSEFADPVEPHQFIAFDDDVTPLSAIPMDYSRRPLLSDSWPEEFAQMIYRPTPPINAQILRTMMMVGTIGYAPNPQTSLRNQVPYDLNNRRGRGVVANLFGSDSRPKSEDNSSVVIPKRYRKVEIKYSRPGSSEFDSHIYNRTAFGGLEFTLSNSYCNAMLQVLYFCEPIRAAVLSHLCQKEYCLSCELSFLFHMLDNSHGLPCQASNFLRAFRTMPEASGLGLILNDLVPASKRNTINFIVLIQRWHTFMIQQIHCALLEKRKQEEKEAEMLKSGPKCEPFVYNEQDFPSILQDIGSRYKNNDEERKKRRKQQEVDDKNNKKTAEENGVQDEETEISRLFGTGQMHINCCTKCGQKTSSPSKQLVIKLGCPPSRDMQEVPFTDVLAGSLQTNKVVRAWCEDCQMYPLNTQFRQVTKLPKILALNCDLDIQENKDFWQSQMDIVVQKATLRSKESSPSISPVPVTIKPCRYGNNCIRADCRFRHVDRDPENLSPSSSTLPTSTSTPIAGTPISHLYYSHSWIPHDIEISLDNNGKLNVEEISSSNIDSNENKRSTDEVLIENGQSDSKDSDDFRKNSEENCNNEVPENMNAAKENNIENSENVTKVRYGLSAVVCYIDDKSSEDKKNIIAHIRVGPNYHARSAGSAVSQWYIFNDVSISPITQEEAVWFNLDWKIPCVLYYTAIPAPEATTPVSPLTYDIFEEDKCIARSGGTRGTFTPLKSDEKPKKGQLVGIDAEFVTLNQEESELRSDGKMSTIKPSYLSVARITCIRGQGPLQGVPFIDDYISTQEQVVDYLTKFSGIQPGDLDANFSSKHLTTLKSTYQKLRLLIDSGVIFVGHGLKTDFRVINVVVPPEQVIDTVILFHLPHRRMVSLRFLTWHYLGKKIQSETHDSAEDALSALELYRKYLDLKEKGILTESLKELYSVGNKLQWKVPDS